MAFDPNLLPLMAGPQLPQVNLVNQLQAMFGGIGNAGQFQVAQNAVPRLFNPANDNRNLQIQEDPYAAARIKQQWNDMVRRGNQPVLQIVPPIGK